MADRNKVTNNLEILIDKARGEYFDFVDLTVDDAVELLALLKEQAPVAPVLRQSIKGIALCCGSCAWEILEVPDTVTYEISKGAISYCPKCGKAVKWDD